MKANKLYRITSTPEQIANWEIEVEFLAEIPNVFNFSPFNPRNIEQWERAKLVGHKCGNSATFRIPKDVSNNIEVGDYMPLLIIADSDKAIIPNAFVLEMFTSEVEINSVLMSIAIGDFKFNNGKVGSIFFIYNNES